MSTFHANVVTGTGRAELRLSGDLDLASADQLQDVADSALGSDSTLAVDLAGVTFLDSTGLGALIKIKNSLTARGGELVITAVSPPVERVMMLTGLAEVLGVAPQAER